MIISKEAKAQQRFSLLPVGQTNFPAEGTKALSVEIGELQPFQYFKKTFSPFETFKPNKASKIIEH